MAAHCAPFILTMTATAGIATISGFYGYSRLI